MFLKRCRSVLINISICICFCYPQQSKASWITDCLRVIKGANYNRTMTEIRGHHSWETMTVYNEYQGRWETGRVSSHRIRWDGEKWFCTAYDLER